MHKAPRQPEHDEQHGHAVPIGRLAVEIEGEHAEHRLDVHALQAVDAAGEIGQLVGRLVEHHRNAEGHHQSRQVGPAQHQEAGEETRCGGHQRGACQAQQRVAPAVLGHQSRGIGAEPEERGMAERDDAGIAEDQVERHRKQGQPQYVGHDQVARWKQEGAGKR